MLKKLLDEKKCFKLICGAGNENLEEVEKLVALYSKAGCHFFDLCASEDVLLAAKKGLDFSVPVEKQKDYHFCVSVGTKDDIHMQKAAIDPSKCTSCGKCYETCPQSAIIDASGMEGFSNSFRVIDTNCIGCQKCEEVCEFGAISLFKKSRPESFALPTFPVKPSCIELHASDVDEDEVDEIWDYLCENFDGMLSLCIGRSKLGNEKVLERIKRLISKREPYTTIIQADGAPMTGGKDDFKTTLQAVAMAEIVQNAKLPVYLLLSGGTNTKTGQLAELCSIDYNGIGVGSFARKIVKEFLQEKDFLTNTEIFDKALKVAKTLVE